MQKGRTADETTARPIQVRCISVLNAGIPLPLKRQPLYNSDTDIGHFHESPSHYSALIIRLFPSTVNRQRYAQQANSRFPLVHFHRTRPVCILIMNNSRAECVAAGNAGSRLPFIQHESFAPSGIFFPFLHYPSRGNQNKPAVQCAHPEEGDRCMSRNQAPTSMTQRG